MSEANWKEAREKSWRQFSRNLTFRFALQQMQERKKKIKDMLW